MLSGGDSALVSGLIMRTRQCSGPSIIDVPALQARDFWRTAANHQSPQVTSEAKSGGKYLCGKVRLIETSFLLQVPCKRAGTS